MAKGKWKIQDYDTFEGEFYGLCGGWDTEKKAKQEAKKRLMEIEKNQPSTQSGGQGFGGIQDQVFIVKPDGSKYRFIG